MIAIYARQSIDKKDSISIETQIEACKNKVPVTNTEELIIFSDKGFSGKSTDRPEFQKMLTEVRNGNVSKIILYKLDRISRSLIDFLNMREEFLKHNVEFVSCAEDFDTTTSTGKLMLNILMMFAEMERETIQKRIKDNYYARGEKGLYLGGYAPFGYNKIEIHVNGKKTYTFEENKKEAVILNEMYNRYLNGESLNIIAKWLNETDIATRKNKPWNGTCVARILRSPVYVKANADVYNYLVSLGGTMNNEIDDYTGKNGCMVYGKATERKSAKFSDLSSDFITIGLHEGIIEPSLWLGVQYMFGQKAGHSNIGTGSLTWLQGLIKCSCGYTYYVKRCKTKVREHKYLYCRGRRNDSCPFPRNMMPVEKMEEIVEEELLTYLENLRKIPKNKIVSDTPEVNDLKIQLSKIDSKIGNLIERVTEGSDLTAQYLNQAIEKLHTERKKITTQISEFQLKTNKAAKSDINIDDIINEWSSYDLKKKKIIASRIIDKIVLEGEDINIIFI